MANQYLYDLTDTWNNVATTFDAIKINVTDTNSAAGSKLLNLQVGASPKFTVQKDGAVALTGAVTGATSITGSGTFTADRLTVTKTTANAPAISSTGYSLTGSNATSLVDLAGTWNTTGNPTAIKLNVTSAASGSSSLLLDLQTDANSKLKVSKFGDVTGAPATIWSLGSVVDINNGYNIVHGSGIVRVVATGQFSFSPSTDARTAADTILTRDGAAGTLAQRNAGNAQTFRVYRTWADASNYEAIELAHATYSSAQYSILRTITAGSGADNINLVLSPSGTGAITAILPDGSATNGNARGSRAVDFQLETNLNTRVASGANSVLIGGRRNTASGTESGVFAGSENVSSAAQSGVFAGSGNLASGSNAVVLGGTSSTASGAYASAIGLQALSNKHSQFAHAGGSFAATGDAQRSLVLMRRATADANATELFLDGSAARLTIPTNTAWHADIRIIGRQVGGANHAIYHRKCCIERTVNATALVSTVQTIGTDIETDANWDVAITADDTNEALKIEVTGVAATNIRWVAEVQLVEVAYA